MSFVLVYNSAMSSFSYFGDLWRFEHNYVSKIADTDVLLYKALA